MLGQVVSSSALCEQVVNGARTECRETRSWVRVVVRVGLDFCLREQSKKLQRRMGGWGVAGKRFKKAGHGRVNIMLRCDHDSAQA